MTTQPSADSAQPDRPEGLLCLTCGEPFKPCKPTSQTCSTRCRNALTARRTAERRGTAQRDRGEGKAYRKLGGRHEHRVVAERKLGRPLRKGEVVHHLNGNKRDNREENIEVLPSQAEHARLHAKRCQPGCTCGRHRKGVKP